MRARSTTLPRPGVVDITATGSGFVVDTEGYIVTAAHVVDGADSLEVTFSDGTTRAAELVGKDDATDVSVIKVQSTPATPAARSSTRAAR
jgi:serine protease Do